MQAFFLECCCRSCQSRVLLQTQTPRLVVLSLVQASTWNSLWIHPGVQGCLMLPQALGWMRPGVWGSAVEVCLGMERTKKAQQLKMVLLCTSKSVRPSFEDPDQTDKGMDRGHRPDRPWSPIQRLFFSKKHEILSGDKYEPYGCCCPFIWFILTQVWIGFCHSHKCPQFFRQSDAAVKGWKQPRHGLVGDWTTKCGHPWPRFLGIFRSP